MNRYQLIIAASATIALTVAIATEPQANGVADARLTSKADRLDIAVRRDPCRSEAWPYISAECVSRSNRIEEPRLATRSVTIEQRPQPGVSVLTRVPVEAVAER